MAFSNTSTAALLILLSVALSPGAATAYTTIAEVPRAMPFDDVNGIPMDVQAKDSQYLKAHMTAAAYKVELFVANQIDKRLSTAAATGSERECLLMCKEVYQSAVENLKEGVESVSANDFLTANSKVSTFTTNIDTCGECFDGFQAFDAWAKGVGGYCLSIIVKYMN